MPPLSCNLLHWEPPGAAGASPSVVACYCCQRRPRVPTLCPSGGNLPGPFLLHENTGSPSSCRLCTHGFHTSLTEKIWGKSCTEHIQTPPSRSFPRQHRLTWPAEHLYVTVNSRGVFHCLGGWAWAACKHNSILGKGLEQLQILVFKGCQTSPPTITGELCLSGNRVAVGLDCSAGAPAIS
jgi:hypothetical protein